MRFVLDASTTLRWCLYDQQTPQSEYILQQMPHAEVYVPSVWPVEIAAVLSRELNTRALTAIDVTNFFKILRLFDISVADRHYDLETLFHFSRNHHLRAYDATYLDLALEMKVPLVTSDKALRDAARHEGVELLI